MRVRSLGPEDPLAKEMATHSSILPWRIPWTEEPVGYSPQGSKESDSTEGHTHARKARGLCLFILLFSEFSFLPVR